MLKREYLRTTGVHMRLKNNLSSECVNLDSEFTLQTMDSRLLRKLAESADASEENTQLGCLQVKVLMSGLSGVSPHLRGGGEAPTTGLGGCTERRGSAGFLPGMGRSRHTAKTRLRLTGNLCLNEVEVIMGSVTLAATDIYTGARRPVPLGSFVSSQPAFPGHINRWFSESWLEKKDRLIMSSGLSQACALSFNLFLGMRDGSTFVLPFWPVEEGNRLTSSPHPQRPVVITPHLSVHAARGWEISGLAPSG